MAGNTLRTLAIEAKFDGSTWTDITKDVIISAGLRLSYGISGHGPLDRTAGSGSLSFTLNNSALNSGALAGYYTPGHINARTGFDLNLAVRVKISIGSLYGAVESTYGDTYYGGDNRVKFIGKVTRITVMPGASRDRRVQVECQDFMWELTQHKMDLLGTQESQRSDELIQSILDNMAATPEATSLGTGQETFLHSGDDLKDEKTTALAAIQKAVVSEFGYAYVEGDGTFVFENRNARLNITSLFTLDGSTAILNPVERGFDLVYNVIKAQSFPRDVGSSPETLYTLRRIIEIAGNATETFTARYTDPSALSTRLSGKDMINPVIDSDYKFGSTGDGSANDKNADLSVVITFGANAALVALENTSGASGFINLLKLRGTALRIYDPIQIERKDTTSITAFGEREFNLALPYQESHLVATDLADITLSNYRNPQFVLPAVGVIGDSGIRMVTAIRLEPGDRITLNDEIANVDNDYFVHSVNMDILPNNVIKVIWSLRLASSEVYWQLGTVGKSELGDTTFLGV